MERSELHGTGLSTRLLPQIPRLQQIFPVVGSGTLPEPDQQPELILGIVAALPAELRCFSANLPLTRPFSVNQNITVIVSGIGSQNSTAACQELINHGVTALISWGTAAGLSPSLVSGDLCLPDAIITRTGNRYPTNSALRETALQHFISSNISCNCGLLFTSEEVIRTRARKKELHQKTGAFAADMESAAIMKIASEHEIPAISVRAIVDDADMELPSEIIALTDQFGRPDLMKLLRLVLINPLITTKLSRLGTAMRKAQKTLGLAAKQLPAIARSWT